MVAWCSAISLGCSVSRLLTQHNQGIAQWSPDPFPHERVGSGHETKGSLVPGPHPSHVRRRGPVEQPIESQQCLHIGISLKNFWLVTGTQITVAQVKWWLLLMSIPAHKLRALQQWLMQIEDLRLICRRMYSLSQKWIFQVNTICLLSWHFRPCFRYQLGDSCQLLYCKIKF